MEDLKINLLKIIPDTVVDGPRMRTSIYVSGCHNHCPGCHNPESQVFGSGTDYTLKEVVNLVESYGHKRVTLSGGDPFWNSDICICLCMELRKRIPEIDIWAYTGLTLGAIQASSDSKPALLAQLDGLVDGPFIEDLRSEDTLWRGSSNQRIWTRDSNNEWTLNNKYN